MKVKVGIIGCGNISAVYFRNCRSYSNLDLVACADLDIERARQRAEEFAIPHAYTVDEILADPDIEIIINLTIPSAHADICMRALQAGKHVYVEKPLVVTREEGQRVLALAKEKQLLVASAPETFMGSGIQACRKLIDEGVIGEPLSATAFMMSRGHEHWHPDPEFYYQEGGGPMFDMGPYYLTALVTLLGPIKSIAGMSKSAFAERTIMSEPKKGQKIPVNTPTHVTGMAQFAQGTIATLIMSFDIFGGSDLHNIEVHGSEGTLRVPDPNGFGGKVTYRRIGEQDWQEVDVGHQYADNNRGIGVSDMAYAIRNNRPHRANGEMAYHVLEAMHGFLDASKSGKVYTMQSSCERPEPVPVHGIDA